MTLPSGPPSPAAAACAVTLRDGRAVLLRALLRSDAEALEEAYQRLSPEARATRFGSPPVSLRGPSLAYLVSADGIDHVAVVAQETGHRPDAPVLMARRPRPAHRIVTAVARGNEPALRLLAAFGRPVRRDDGMVEVELD